MPEPAKPIGFHNVLRPSVEHLFVPEERKLIDQFTQTVAASEHATCPYCLRPISRLVIADHLPVCRQEHDEMPEPTEPVVLRANRFELVDEQGDLRAIIGKLPGVDGRGYPQYGLSLRDHHDRERVWLAVDGNGPILGFDQAGQNVIYLGVADEGSEMIHPGPYFSLCEPEGGVVITWRVGLDGNLEIEQRETNT